MFIKGLKITLLFLCFLFTAFYFTVSSPNNIFYPADFRKAEAWPCLLVYASFSPAEMKKSAEETGRVVISLPALNPDRRDLLAAVRKDFIDKRKISCIAEGPEGLKFVLRNPLFFADAVILYSEEEEKKMISLLRDDPVIEGNINRENIFLVPEDKHHIPGQDLQGLIDKKEYPVRIKNISGLPALAGLCKDTRVSGIDELKFFTDDPHYNQCAWLKVYYPWFGPADISAELGDDEVLLYSLTIDSFCLDLSWPEFDNWEKDFTVKLNYNTVYYGKKPQNKKLYIYNSAEVSFSERPFVIQNNKGEEGAVKKSEMEKVIEPPVRQVLIPAAVTQDTARPAEPVLNPMVRARTEPEIFTPGRDNVKMSFENITPAEIKEWKVDITLPGQEIFRQIKGKDDFKNEVSWDGKNEQGEYLPNGVDCTFQLKYLDNKNCFNKSRPFPLKTGLQIIREEKKLSIEMQEVLFNINSAKLSIEARDILFKVRDVIEQNSINLKEVVIEGHTDNSGNSRFNLRLSEKRAESVQEFIKQNSGIAGKFFRAQGLGDTRPAYANDTPGNRKKNRRVTITINLK